MSLALRFTRECMKPVHATGRMIVATNMSKIIGLVALSIPSFETIEGLLIACIRPDIHAHTHIHTNGMSIFSHSHHTIDMITVIEIADDGGGQKLKKKKNCRVKWKFNIPSVFRPVRSPFWAYISVLLSLCLTHTHTHTCTHSQIYTPISSSPALP